MNRCEIAPANRIISFIGPNSPIYTCIICGDWFIENVFKHRNYMYDWEGSVNE